MPKDNSHHLTKSQVTDLMRSSRKLRSRIATLSSQLTREFGPAPLQMKAQDAWLNRLAAGEETLPRGKFFDRFRRKDKLEQYCLVVAYLRDAHNRAQ